MSVVKAQIVLRYGPEEPTASVHYNEFLYGIYKNTYNVLPVYPVKGAYSPTHYARPSDGIQPGVGACNYIYFPTKGTLVPGHQYRISLTVVLSEAYDQMPYFQSNFGVALTSNLSKNYMGLWRKHYLPLNIQTTNEPVTVEMVFRPLCTSEYFVIGVFQGPDMDSKDCFGCQYGFELGSLTLEVWSDPKADFAYLCDAFEEDRLEKKFSSGYDTVTIYFESGYANIQDKYLSILDSIPTKLRTKQDMVNLYAYTDLEGSENESLGAERNEAVRKALIARGVDTIRISTVNFGEMKASDRITQEDRRVEIVMNRCKLFQKFYTEAIQASESGDYRIAQAKMSQWIKLVPPEKAIYALFDCWGQGKNSDIFKRDLVNILGSRYYYKGNNLKFMLDSLYCEDQKGRTLSMYLRLNHLPDYQSKCGYTMDSLLDSQHQQIVDQIYTEFGFPTVKAVGDRGNKVLPYMILHARDTSFQNHYLPLMQKACEDQLISWEYYAMLYDKINIIRNGHQRYGTQWIMDKFGALGGLYPFEDAEMIAEYRKRVGLAPLSDY